MNKKECVDCGRLLDGQNCPAGGVHSTPNRIEELATEFDINQRLFLSGKLHSTQFNRWFLTEAISAIQQAERDAIREIIKNEPGTSLPDSYSESDDIISKKEILTRLENKEEIK